MGGMTHCVGFKLELENYSNTQLGVHEEEVHTGQINKPPTAVKPGTKEAMYGHKTSDAATGCVGTVAWKLEGKGKMLVVMYSIPYSHDFHSNWLGVGIFNLESTGGYYDKMYYQTQVGFQRKDFWSNLSPVSYSDGEYTVEATMGNSHKAEIRVTFCPNNKHNLASTLKPHYM